MAVCRIDDTYPGKVDAELFGQGADLALRADQDGLDDAGVESHDRAAQGFLVAGMGDSSRNRVETFATRESNLGIAGLLVVDVDFRGVWLSCSREIFSLGASTSAVPTHDLQVFLIDTDAVENAHACCVRTFCLTVTVMTIRSPMVTGRAKCSDWSIRIVPGPGNWVASTVEISDPLHMPWAMASRNMPLSE
jgi:hypothetical protein